MTGLRDEVPEAFPPFNWPRSVPSSPKVAFPTTHDAFKLPPTGSSPSTSPNLVSNEFQTFSSLTDYPLFSKGAARRQSLLASEITVPILRRRSESPSSEAVEDGPIDSDDQEDTAMLDSEPFRLRPAFNEPASRTDPISRSTEQFMLGALPYPTPTRHHHSLSATGSFFPKMYPSPSPMDETELGRLNPFFNSLNPFPPSDSRLLKEEHSLDDVMQLESPSSRIVNLPSTPPRSPSGIHHLRSSLMSPGLHNLHRAHSSPHLGTQNRSGNTTSSTSSAELSGMNSIPPSTPPMNSKPSRRRFPSVDAIDTDSNEVSNSSLNPDSEDVGMIFSSLSAPAPDSALLPASPATSISGRSSTGPVRRPIARRANLLVSTPCLRTLFTN